MGICFKCGGETIIQDICGVKTEICKSCNSVVLTKENFEALSGLVDKSSQCVDLFALPNVKVKEDIRVCKNCNSEMGKIYYNGIVLDRCLKCNIVLFDNGELSRFFSKATNKPIELTGNVSFLKSICEQNKVSVTEQTNEKFAKFKQSPVLKISSKENEIQAAYADGWLVVGILFILTLIMLLLLLTPYTLIFAVFLFVSILFSCGGFRILKPQEALVLTVFGKYTGTIKKPGFFWVNPFADKFVPTISLKARTHNNAKQKINDLMGNPIEIGIMVTWEVQDTAKATFNVDNYNSFLAAQCDSALRNITRLYPYDASEDSGCKSLRGDSAEISEKLKIEIQNNVLAAGIRVLDARITHLAYSSEIAAAMLQRQQANAVIDAKRALVDGAVGMVEMALDKLAANPNVTLDEKTKASMVNNLLVVLCGNKDSQPVLRSDII